ncbi:two pore domain potassium channel family protein, partial [Candidatus Poribacteria bacterium]|nr:two pore domain potassium channel family protein [Candidatus Poribacteria bacterium]
AMEDAPAIDDDTRPTGQDVGLWPLLRICLFTTAMIIVAGTSIYWLETRALLPLDEEWVGNPGIVARETYAEPDGSVIVAKGDPFRGVAGDSHGDESDIGRLRDAGFTTVRVITHEVFADLPDAIRWAAVTVATVGYRDRRPTTGPGRAEAVMVMTMGLALLWGLVTTLAATLHAAVRRTRPPRPETQSSNGGKSRASWRKHLDATTVAAVIIAAFGSLLAPWDVFFWLRARPAGFAVALVLAALCWMALLAVAVGVYRKNAVCAVTAFMWWGLAEAFVLYAPPKMPAWWHVREPSVHAHILWVVGAVFLMRVYLPAITTFVERRRRPAPVGPR